MLDRNKLRTGINFFYSGSGFYREDLIADVRGTIRDYNGHVDILDCEEITKEEYEQGTGEPFRLGYPDVGESSFYD